MSDAVVSGVLLHTARGGVRTVNGREVTSNIARLHVDRVFQGKVPTGELQFVWYSLHWPKTRMGVIYRRFLSVASPELREAAGSWLNVVQSRHLQCEQSGVL